MTSHHIRRATATFTATALIASLTVAAVAASASATRPKCFGQTATIVGTDKADRIIGTNKRDVIVAKGGADRIFGRGGNDLICAGDGNDRVVGNAGIDKLIGGRGADRMFGGAGPDRLFGGPGPDTIAGQPGNDVIDGGLGVDTCYQGLGFGPVVRCELPAAPAPMPPPPPAPPKTLALAYSDVNGNHVFDAGDVMISKLVDTNLDKEVSPGDTIEMGKYPTEIVPSVPAHFADWRDKSHVVASVGTDEPDRVAVMTEALTVHRWLVLGGQVADEYWEEGSGTSYIRDRDPDQDWIWTEVDSPSLPGGNLQLSNGGGTHDDRLIDVDIYH